MTIDTSKEAVERLLDGVTPGPWRYDDNDLFETIRDADELSIIHGGREGDLVASAADANFIAAARELVPALAAERDAQTARADAAEAEVARRLEMHECAMAERDDCIEDWSKAKEQIARLTAELSALRAKLDAHKLRGDNHWETMRCIYRIATKEGDLQAIIQHITDAGQGYTEDPEETLRRYQTELAETKAELTALRAGQDALVAATVEAAVQALILDLGHLTEDQSLTGPYALRRAMEAIRALTPSDATAALDAMLRAERNKVLRDAAAVKKTDKFGDDWLGMSCAILAMIEPEGK